MEYLKIPKERIGVLIGHKGETRKTIEDYTGVKLEIDSKTGEISIDDHQVDDPLAVLKVKNIVKAIGRGFSPQKALKLIDENLDFYVFHITEFVGKKDSHIKRVKARVIGRQGKTKNILEKLTDSDISVYGHTISIISSLTNIDITKKAIDMLLRGSKHATVYRFVEREMKNLKIKHRTGFF